MRQSDPTKERVTPSGVTIDASKCIVCGAEATAILGFYVLIGPIEVPVCDEHIDSPEQERQLAAYPAYSCAECGQPLSKVYCGRCDEFYNSGHSRNCSRLGDPRNQHDHA